MSKKGIPFNKVLREAKEVVGKCNCGMTLKAILFPKNYYGEFSVYEGFHKSEVICPNCSRLVKFDEFGRNYL